MGQIYPGTTTLEIRGQFLSYSLWYESDIIILKEGQSPEENLAEWLVKNQPTTKLSPGRSKCSHTSSLIVLEITQNHIPQPQPVLPFLW